MENLRTAAAFRTKKDKRHYYMMFALFIALALYSAFGLLTFNNPVPVTSPSFGPVVVRRMNAIITMLIATTCQALGTVAFQSVTNNRVITPSLLGYEALYSTIQTATMFLFGASAFFALGNISSFLLQVAAMVLLSLLLYGWLLTGEKGNLQLMLLVGIMIGTGLRSLSGFMRRLLAPSEFDILQAKLFGSVNNADASYFPYVIPIVFLCAVALMLLSRRLNVMAMGRDVSINLGVDHQKNTIFVLILVSILMSVSTALIGPLTFFGFLSANLAYQVTKTYDYRYLFPMTLAIGFLILSGSYFLMYHVFDAQGVVSILIELIGGIVFLGLLFRKDKV